jgi:hypothetical protein
MAKSSKIEPVNIDLYERAWARSGRGVAVLAKKPSRKKKPRRKRKTK